MFGVLSVNISFFFFFFLVYVLACSQHLVHAWVRHTPENFLPDAKKKGEEEEEKKRRKFKWDIARGDFNLTMS